MRALLLALLAYYGHACGQTLSGGVRLSGSVTLGGTPPATGWVQMSVPVALSSAAHNELIWVDHNNNALYAATYSTNLGCAATTAAFRRDPSTLTWADITGTGFPSGCNLPMKGFISFPNGNVCAIIDVVNTSGTRQNYTAYCWNGSVGSPIWTQISGGPGQAGNANASNNIYTNDWVTRADNTTCFAAGGQVFCNASPNSLAFTLQTTNSGIVHGVFGSGFYWGTGSGAITSGTPDTGAVYAMADFDAGDGRGEQLWGCGEGDALETNPYTLSTLYTDFVDFVPKRTDLTGWTGNCAAIARGPTSMLIFRQIDTSSPYASGSVLAHIALPSMAVTEITLASGYPSSPSNNGVGTLEYVSGTGANTKWVWGVQNSTRHIMYSVNDGTTWTELTSALMALDTGCSSAIASLALNTTTDGTYLYTRCMNTSTGQIDFWSYR